MENEQAAQQETVDKVYGYAADLLVNKKMNARDVEFALVDQGLSTDAAHSVVENLSNRITEAKKGRAKKDMIYGALWCVGGIIATAADIGFIFWGAILFGAIQFFRGVVNA